MRCIAAPLTRHPAFGAMSVREWLRWGWLHAESPFAQFSE
jgi:hypothetical protein